MSANDSTESQHHSSGASELESFAKAAAWVWYLHGKGNGREGGYVYQTRNRERRESRFKIEAMKKDLSGDISDPIYSEAGWDCESKLYDSFELLTFTDRLDRTLTASPTLGAPNCHHPRSPLHQSIGLPRTLSVPRDPSLYRDSHSSPSTSFGPSHSAGENGNVNYQSRWSIRSFVKALKKVASNTIRKRLRVRSLEHEQEHRHRHHHHHRLCHLSKAGEGLIASIQVHGKT